MDKKILISGIFLIALLILPFFTLGIGVSPTILTYESMMKGVPNRKQIMLFNTEDKDKYYEIYVSGNMSEWFSFSEKSFKIPSKSNKVIVVTVTPPSDIPNGIYENIIYIKEIANVTGGDGAIVGIERAVGVKTIMNITGNEIISGVVHKISVRDTEIGNPVQFLVRYSNTGNVRSSPKINIKISKGREHIDSIEKKITLSAGENKDILVEWDTSNQDVGDYYADVKVFLNNKKIAGKIISFKILPKRAFTNIEVISVNAPEIVEVGKPAKIEVMVKNTGARNVIAKILGEVYLNNELTGTINSENVLIYPGRTGTLIAYFTSEKPGTYIIKSNVLYEGKSVKVNDITINVKGAITTKNHGEGLLDFSFPLVWSIALAAIFVILILTIFIFMKFK